MKRQGKAEATIDGYSRALRRLCEFFDSPPDVITRMPLEAYFESLDGCRSGQYGEITWACETCPEWQVTPGSCGHRLCNQCQHPSTEAWLERQQQKRLPVNYYMATFTLPRQWRPMCEAHPLTMYNLLLSASAVTIKTFASNDATLSGELGFCSVLHTHTRRLDFHPHVHVVIPPGVLNKNAVNKERREWRKASGDYLFRQGPGDCVSSHYEPKAQRSGTSVTAFTA